jgi:DNA-binding CsgD family transcriptional regulator
MMASVNEWSKVLSPRERQIAVLVGRGMSNKDVARELGLRVGTVKIHAHNIFQKIGVRSRYDLIAQHGTRARAVPSIVSDAKSRPSSRSRHSNRKAALRRPLQIPVR